MQSALTHRLAPRLTRNYAISVTTVKKLQGKKQPRVFKDKKAFQYNWYSRILTANTTSPILILNHDDFTAERLKKLRGDISLASQKAQPSSGTTTSSAQPTLTVVRTSIFGAALRSLPGVNLREVKQMVDNTYGQFAVLSLPSLHPPQLGAILRAMERSVPPKLPKTEEELRQAREEKNADPAQPGRRMKRVRKTRIPGLKVMGAIIENQVFMPNDVQTVSKLPGLDTLRAQIVGLLSAPAAQLAAVLSETSGGQLARTLEGFRKGLEESSESSTTDSAPSS